MKRPAALVALGLSLVLVACSGSDGSVAVDAVGTSDTADGATEGSGGAPGTDVDSGTSTVVVTDVGDEPRAELRHQWEVGTQGTVRVTNSQTITQRFDDAPAETIEVPTMILDTEVEVRSVDGGVATVEQRAVDARALESDPALDDVLEALRSMTSTMMIGPRGEVLDSSTELDGEVPGVDLAALADSASQAAVPLPVEAVGVGAEWEATTKVAVLGVEVLQITHYRLIERRPDGVVLSFTVEQLPPGNDLQIPGLPAGTTVEVEEWTITGSGRAEVTFGQIVPDVEINMSGRQALRFDLDGGSSTIYQELTSTLLMTLAE